MVKKHFILTEIKDHKIVNKTPLAKLLWELKDGKYEIEFKSVGKRSNHANRYYFGLIVPMVQQGIKEMGTEITKEETHEFLKARFNFSELVNEETGECFILPRSTTTLSKEQFSEYIAKIQMFAAQFLNVVIPDPGVQVMIDY